MADGVKEEELGDYKCLNQHDRAGDDNRYQADNVQEADDVENDVAWPSQGSFKERHFWVRMRVGSGTKLDISWCCGLMFA